MFPKATSPWGLFDDELPSDSVAGKISQDFLWSQNKMFLISFDTPLTVFALSVIKIAGIPHWLANLLNASRNEFTVKSSVNSRCSRCCLGCSTHKQANLTLWIVPLRRCISLYIQWPREINSHIRNWKVVGNLKCWWIWRWWCWIRESFEPFANHTTSQGSFYSLPPLDNPKSLSKRCECGLDWTVLYWLVSLPDLHFHKWMMRG